MKIFFIVASDQIKKEPIILTPCQFSSHLKQNRHRVKFYFDIMSGFRLSTKTCLSTVPL